jgi:superfamily II DNA or RNA helicase
MSIILKPHQQLPVKYLRDHRGLILFHNTGSGKTLTALYGLYQLPYPIAIIGTKSTKKTFDDNIKKAGFDASRFTFYTYTKIKKLVETDISYLDGLSVILDEAHAIRNENVANLYLISALTPAKRIVLLTATPVINYLNDLSVLVNVVKGQDVLPTDKELFAKMYYDTDSGTVVNRDMLFEKMYGTISYYNSEDNRDESEPSDYPELIEEYVNVQMDHDQIEEYVYYIKKIIYEDKNIVDRSKVLEIDYSLLPFKKKNYFLSVTRQLSNIAKVSDTSPKIDAIIDKIIEGPHPCIVYSNYLHSGIYNIALALEKQKINYKSITGFTSSDKISLLVDNYNKGLYTVLLLSSAGSESLDLKGTRQVHIMEPHWNDPRVDQVIGRSRRYRSHSHLPEDQRTVCVYRWISVFPSKIRNDSADQYLRKISEQKTALWRSFLEIIKQVSIENNFFGGEA